MKTKEAVKHTPGDWNVVNDGAGSRVIRGKGGVHVARVGFLAFDDEADANARLIAASPEMLSAIISSVNHLHDCYGGRSEMPSYIRSICDSLDAAALTATGKYTNGYAPDTEAIRRATTGEK